MIALPRKRLALAAALGALAAPALAAPPASAGINPIKPLCDAVGFFSGALGRVCSVAQHPGRVLSAGKQLLTGHLGGAAKTLVGDSSSGVASTVTTRLALAGMVLWVIGGAEFALDQTAHILGRTTSPQLGSLWFSSTYWRVAAVAALLTLPFLFAAAIQAMLASDVALLLRAACGYLPLAGLAVGIAAPVAMLLLSASDELSSIVSASAGGASGHFLGSAGRVIGAISLEQRSPFLVFFAGLLTVGAALVLWLELLMRASAVYVIVLLLPLAFAAMVWPARRIWAVRAVELLIALILSKFAIVAVLSLGGAAISQSAMHSVTGLIAGVTLLGLGICAPWALLRLLPMAELASGAVSTLRGDAMSTANHVWGIRNRAGRAPDDETPAEPDDGQDWTASTTAQMRHDHETAAGATEAAGLPDSQPPAGEGDSVDAAGVAEAAPEPELSSAAPSAPAGPPASAAPEPDTAAPAAARAPQAEPLTVPQCAAEDLTLEPLVLGPDADWIRDLRPPREPEDDSP